MPVRAIRPRTDSGRLSALALAVFAAACLADAPLEPEPTVPDTISLVGELDVARIGGPSPEPGRPTIWLALFLHLRDGADDPGYLPAEIEGTMTDLVQHAQQVFAACGISVAVESAAVIQLPLRLRAVRGNESGSWGGHPPPGTADPALFNYEQDERLTEHAREIFGFAKRSTSPNSIAVVFVESITYHTGPEILQVDGLSYPPNLYHHPDDYPLRNSVLSVEPGELGDDAAFVMAHEVGHMLLNSGLHATDPSNLMNDWGSPAILLTDAQCERASDVLVRLYGDEAVPDPGPPS